MEVLLQIKLVMMPGIVMSVEQVKTTSEYHLLMFQEYVQEEQLLPRKELLLISARPASVLRPNIPTQEIQHREAVVMGG